MYSVIIPVRDRVKQLPLCLVGALWQDFEGYEVVVVDYGSKPPIQVPNPVRLLRWEANEWNVSIALNVGIANARGDRLIILNADDIMSPDLLDIVDTRLSKNPRRRLYWRRFDLTAEGQRALEQLGSEGSRSLFESDASDSWRGEGLGRWGGTDNLGDFLVVQKAPLVELGGYDERMVGWGYYDVDMDHRLEKLGYEKAMGKEFKLIHQYHEVRFDRSASNRRNRALSSKALEQGILVRNGGPEHLRRYHL